MPNFLITIAFDGSRYHGFQVQDNALSVCEVFQDAVEKVMKKRWDVKGCSRTDSGVHALEYCLSMNCDSTIPPEGLCIALDHCLPDDITVLKVQIVSEDFHARYHCVGKEYTYRVFNSVTKDPFRPTGVLRYPWEIDVSELHQQAQDLVGEHDFSSFCAKAGLGEDMVRRIYSFSVTREQDDVLFVVRGDGFLYNMVRIMVGTLLFIASGRIQSGSIPDIIRSKNRDVAGKTVPAKGLYLTKVFYSFDEITSR